jgi:hypothetical protein
LISYLSTTKQIHDSTQHRQSECKQIGQEVAVLQEVPPEDLRSSLGGPLNQANGSHETDGGVWDDHELENDPGSQTPGVRHHETQNNLSVDSADVFESKDVGVACDI